MNKRWLLVFQSRVGSQWKDDFSNKWPRFEFRSEALKLKAIWNTDCLARRGHRYIVRKTTQ